MAIEKRLGKGRRTQKRPPPGELEAFFAGVDEVRAYLERSAEDPARGRTRLAKIAQDLVRHRDAEDLVRWLASSLLESLGGKGGSFWLREDACGSADAFRPWLNLGGGCEVPGTGPPPWSASGSASALSAADSGLWLKLAGPNGIVGVLWLQGSKPPDAENLALVEAIAETAGLLLEQRLRLEKLQRDPGTGLLGRTAFIERAGARLAAGPPPRRTLMVVVFRIAGMQELRVAWGRKVALSAVTQLGRAVEACLGDEAIIGLLSDDVCALLATGPFDRADVEAASIAQSVHRALTEMTADPGPSRAAAAGYALFGGPAHGLPATLDAIGARVGELGPGAVQRVRLKHTQ